jgi:hypothetical protein
MRARITFPVVPDNHSRPAGWLVERVTLRGQATYNSAAIALAASTSGPGSGTKTVRR